MQPPRDPQLIVTVGLGSLDALVELDRELAGLADEALAQVGQIARIRRAAIASVLNDDGLWEGEARYKRARRVQAIADALGVTPKSVYQAAQRAQEDAAGISDRR